MGTAIKQDLPKAVLSFFFSTPVCGTVPGKRKMFSKYFRGLQNEVRELVFYIPESPAPRHGSGTQETLINIFHMKNYILFFRLNQPESFCSALGMVLRVTGNKFRAPRKKETRSQPAINDPVVGV